MGKTYPGTVIDGQIRLESDIRLPEHAHIYVVVPDAGDAPAYRIATPRLAHPEQAKDFQMEVVDEVRDAGV